jgi:colanic acid/amylovoran biosynthesis protein
MNILIINQPVENRGDESAHRSLMRALIEQCPAAHITVAFVGEDEESVRQMEVLGAKVKYVAIPMKRGASRIPALAFKLRLRRLVAFLHPAYRQLKRMIEAADYVVNAPGGICMGGFRSWRHIFYLMMARDCGRSVAYYSRSFGPFSETTGQDRLFRRISLLLLNSFDFLAIRDRSTMKFADQLGLRYTTAIDTAFLDVPNASIPSGVTTEIGTTDYVVFVPNALMWHVDYRGADSHRIDGFFLRILDLLRTQYPSSKVVMLPQLFNAGTLGDSVYFIDLRSRSSHRQHVVVLPDCYGSDIQQAIIGKARLVVGARYHSIVFAVNNRVPFVALSYEHKISGMLATLNIEDRALDIRLLGTPEFDEAVSLQCIKNLLNQSYLRDAVGNRANEIARECFQSFAKRLDAVAKPDLGRDNHGRA